MKKNLLSTICVTLVMALCTMSIAQNIQVKVPSPGAVTQITTHALEATTALLVCNKGPESPLYYSTASNSSPGVYKTTLGTFNTAAQQLSTITLSYQAMVEVDNVIYIVTYNSSNDANTFGKIDNTTGQFTQIKATAPDAISMACNPVDNKVYYTIWGTGTSSQFGEIDITTGNHTPKGNVPGLFYIAIDNDGVCYGVGTSGVFGTVNLANGAFSQISTYGDLNFIQDMAVDFETNELYHFRRWGTTTAPGTPSLRKINKSTGAVTELGQFHQSLSVESFVIIGGGEPVDPCPAVTNVTATQFESNKITVNWTAATGDVANYKIYQGSSEVATVAAGTTTWTSAALASGTYTYEVAATYDDGCIPVKVAANPVEIKTCNGVVSNLEVEYATDCSKATITWDAPAKSRAYADAYILDTYSTGGYYSIILETGVKTSVGPKPTFLTDETPTGDDFDGTTMYRITNFGRVFSVAENGAQTLIGTISGITNCIGLAYDWINQDGFYFVDILAGNTAFNLHKLSIPSLEKTLIGTAAGTFRRGLALAADGYLYSLTTSVTTAPSNLIRVDPSNGQITTVGPIDFPAMYGFDLAYDRVEDVLYASPIHFDPAPTNPQHVSKLISINTTTGAATLIHNYGLLQHSTLSCTKGGFEPPVPEVNIYRDGVHIGGPTTETTFVDDDIDPTKGYTWSVAVACSNGGDGEWVNKTMPACGEVVCNPATNLAVEIVVETCVATLSWTAAADMPNAQYNVYRDGVKIGTVSATEFVDNTLESDVDYTWTVKTICENGEADPATVTDICTVGITDPAKATFSIVPNPASDKVKISAEINFHTVEVVSFLGQIVLSQSNASNTASLDVSALTNGIYFVRIVSDNGTNVKKFVKQ